MINKKVMAIVFNGALVFLITGLYNCAGRKIIGTIPVIEGARYTGSKDCSGCHDKCDDRLPQSFHNSVHGRLAKFEAMGRAKGCEGCHGPASIHVETSDPTKIICFKKEMNAASKSEICLTCHTMPFWRGGEHTFNGISCVDCHNIHTSKGQKLLAKPEMELCFDCHKEIRAKTLYPSHHPMREEELSGRRRMRCSDCHDVHGSADKNLKTETGVNALCLNCHAKYQGPFIYEHSPVVENCIICHEPHGTVSNNLLKKNEPFLCLQCHELHFHAGKKSNAGNLSNPDYETILNNYTGEKPVLHGQFPAHGMKKAFATKCTQCHSQIHGSDLPSQTVPGRGKGLTR